MGWELASKAKIKRYAASREAAAAGFQVHGVSPEDPRWVRVTAPDGTRAILFRVGARKWHSFYYDVEATGSGHGPLEAMSGGLGDVIDTDSQLRSYSRQVIDAPSYYLKRCDGLYRASVAAYNG